MRELIEKLNKSTINLSKLEKKEALKFSKRLESYTHVPTNKKEIERMNSFISNEFLVSFVLQIIENYKYPRESKYPFDIISYWYCLCFLILSNQDKATEFSINLGNQFLEKNHNDLWQFRRLLEFIDNPKFKVLTKNIENYFLSKQNDLESYKWAKEIGLELPNDNNWALFFEISTDGRFRFGNDLTPKEKESRLRITTSVYPLQGGKCWEIELKNWNNTVSARWPTLFKNEIRLEKKRKNYVLKIEPSLRNLKLVIEEIETILDTRFDKTMYMKRFKGKIKNKNAVKKWLLE
ncbi:hypothetical protein [uncultured Maribacter sp.]|uniref:hypothetical protein n=1 Tax=uncultured Maribacter sp. TaxID=431308 RepID=UPI002608F002|nr:hypothetical protein [uncultured Maribacter sp.]